jgi:hypothetical protein
VTGKADAPRSTRGNRHRQSGAALFSACINPFGKYANCRQYPFTIRPTTQQPANRKEDYRMHHYQKINLQAGSKEQEMMRRANNPTLAYLDRLARLRRKYSRTFAQTQPRLVITAKA